MYNWDWSVIWRNREAFFYGLLETCWLSFLAIVLGTAIAVALVAARRSYCSILRFLAVSYVKIIRAIYALILLLWIYNVLPAIGIRLSEIQAAVLGLALNGAAFYSENMRAGLESISSKQRESALALGMSSWQTMWRIIIPQATRNILPNLLNEYVTTIKLTSLASVIGVAELVNRGESISSVSHRPLEVYTALAVLYLLIIVPLDFLVSRFERKLGRYEGDGNVR